MRGADPSRVVAVAVAIAVSIPIGLTSAVVVTVTATIILTVAVAVILPIAGIAVVLAIPEGLLRHLRRAGAARAQGTR